MYSASNYCSKNIQYLTTLRESGFLPCTEHILRTACFAKSGSITVICLRTQQNPYYQPPCTAPTPLSLVLRFGYTPHAHKSQRALLVSRRSTWLVDWQSQIFCGRSQKSVSAVRALRQTGRWIRGRAASEGCSSTCIDLNRNQDLVKRVQSL
jgi:hypothetical protein